MISLGLFLISFCLTWLTEFGIFWAFFQKQPTKLLWYSLLINLFSWPLANISYDFYPSLWVIEAAVILVESFLLLLFLRGKYFKILLASLAANVVSFLFGLLLLGF